MLSNKYLIAVLALLLLGVAGWNINFFYARRNAATQVTPSVRQVSGGENTAPVHRDKPPVLSFPEQRDAGVWRRDPFRKSDTVRGTIPPGDPRSAAGEEIRLKGVIISNGRPFALVNGWVVGVGDAVYDYKVSAISQYSILLKGAEGQREISITNDKLKEN